MTEIVKSTSEEFEALSLSELFELTSMGNIEAAKALHFSPSTISLLRNGKYSSINNYKEKQLRLLLINRAMELDLQVKEGRQVFRFTTEGQEHMKSVLKVTKEDGEFSLIISESGTGKTHTARDFATKEFETIYIKAMKNLPVGGFLRVLSRAFQLPESDTKDMMLAKLFNAFHGRCRLAIVDEADLLFGRQAEAFLDKIEILRELYENGLAIAMIGLPVLEEALVRHAQSYVYSRIGYHARISPPGMDELLAYARQKGIEDPFVARQSLGRGYFRFIDKVAKRVKDVGLDAALGLIWGGGR
jgi:DNA transposition AAA+ family ATPase